jgi:hypothetical protein
MLHNKETRSALSAELRIGGGENLKQDMKMFPHYELKKVLMEWLEGICSSNVLKSGKIIRERLQSSL